AINEAPTAYPIAGASSESRPPLLRRGSPMFRHACTFLLAVALVVANGFAVSGYAAGPDDGRGGRPEQAGGGRAADTAQRPADPTAQPTPQSQPDTQRQQ